MAKLYIKYEFDTGDLGDQYELQTLQNALKYRRLLNEIFIKVRKEIKHGDPKKGSWEDTYNLIWDLADEEDVAPFEDIF